MQKCRILKCLQIDYLYPCAVKYYLWFDTINFRFNDFITFKI